MISCMPVIFFVCWTISMLFCQGIARTSGLLTRWSALLLPIVVFQVAKVFQRRRNGKTNFYREWEPYKYGFGNLKEEFWLGNEYIHQLTSKGNYILRIQLEDFENTKRNAEYKIFHIGDEKSGYKLTISGYHGNAGDAMARENGQKFSTKDRENDVWDDNCAKKFKGAWWYQACHDSNLNGLYLKGKHQSFADGIEWRQWRGYNYSLKKTSMMLRRA